MTCLVSTESSPDKLRETPKEASLHGYGELNIFFLIKLSFSCAMHALVGALHSSLGVGNVN